jgi:hypothetical protein
VREWKEIGGLLLTDSGTNLIVRANTFSQDGTHIKGIDVVLRADEVYELYVTLKCKLAAAINDKLCSVCKHYKYYGCMHPDREVRGYVCEREQRKYYEPRFQL